MSEVLERSSCDAGDSIFEEGDEGTNAFIVQAGAVEIVKTIDGKTVVLGTVGKGGIFGEMALIDDQPRMAAARAAEPTTVIIVTREMFEQKLAKTDPFVRGLLKIFASNIRTITQDNTDGSSSGGGAGESGGEAGGDDAA